MDSLAGTKMPATFPQSPARYRLEALCGQGGAGSVYRAFDRELGRVVALKFLRDDRPHHHARMVREARAQARIDHPNVCRIFDISAEGDRLFIAMQWLDAQPLNVAAVTLSIEQRIRILRDVAAGVQAAHEQGVIHRDLKPANILVDGSLHPFVVDFGLARAVDEAGTTATGEIIGTPQYLSPEQAWGLPVDRRSDVYSLGATMYELLAGSPPFVGDTPTAVIMDVISRPAGLLHQVNRSIPRDLSVIASKCLAKEPERRYESARAVGDDLQRWLRGEPIAARAPGLLVRSASMLRRHRSIAVAITLAATLTGGLAGYRILGLQRDRRQQELAARLEDRVRYIEHLMDHDRALPLHDTRPAVRRAFHEIALIAAERGNEKAAFPAAYSYAEGRARLATGDLDAAQKLLSSAWSSGFRSPAASYAYAVALTAEYARTLAAAERIQDDALRRKRILDAGRDYRRRIEPLLQTALASVEQPAELVEARLAYAVGDDTRTGLLADEVVARFPWSNEARLLHADAALRAARMKRMNGDINGAEAEFDQARRVLREAAVIAPSDPQIHDGLCLIAVDLMQRGGPFSTQMRSDDPARFEEAKESCARTLIADPGRVTALTSLSSAWSIRAFLRQHGGATGAAETENAQAAIRKALAIAPSNPEVLIQAGLTEWRIGFGHAETAAALLRRAVAADPRSPDARHALGRALLLRNDELMTRGADPRAVLQEAIAQYREALRLSPDFTGAWNNLAIALGHMGRYAARNGNDPEPYDAQAIAILERLIQRRPDLSEPHSVCAWVWMQLADWRSKHGGDLSKPLAESALRYDEAVRLNPTYLGDRNGRALARLMQAKFAADAAQRDRDLALAKADIDFMESTSPGTTAPTYAQWVEIKAEHALPSEALSYFDQGRTALRDFLKRQNPQDGATWLTLTHLEKTRCWLLPLHCDAALVQFSYSRALRLTPNLGDRRPATY